MKNKLQVMVFGLVGGMVGTLLTIFCGHLYFDYEDARKHDVVCTVSKGCIIEHGDMILVSMEDFCVHVNELGEKYFRAYELSAMRLDCQTNNVEVKVREYDDELVWSERDKVIGYLKVRDNPKYNCN